MAAGLELAVAARKKETAQHRVEMPVRTLGEIVLGVTLSIGFQTQRW
jgi:hypothetical protein